MAVAGDERVAAIRTGNEKCGRLVEEVDFEMAQARYRILSKQGDLANLANALKSHLPSIAADARQISVSADLLKENFVALESRMFNLLLAKAIAEQETWSKQQHQMANEYVAAKSSLEVQAEGDPIVAQKLLAYEEEGSQGRDASSSAGGAASSAASFLQGAATAIFSGNAGSAAAAAGASLRRAASDFRLPADFPTSARQVAALAAALDAQIQRNVQQSFGTMGRLSAFVQGGTPTSSPFAPVVVPPSPAAIAAQEAFQKEKERLKGLNNSVTTANESSAVITAR